MVRVALYGGSFNPPHVCHVMTCAYVLASAPVDAIWLLPVGHHPFAKNAELLPFAHRHRMCELAVELFGSRVAVSDVESRLPGPNRTVDTVDHLRRENPGVGFSLVMGTDLFRERHLWKDFDRLERTVPFIVLEREGYPPPPGVAASPILPDVSSSEIRQRLANGTDVSTLVPAGVADYIRAHGLYGVRDPRA